MSGQVWQAREAVVEVYQALRDTLEGGHRSVLVALPPSMSSVHEVFQVFMLRKYTPYPAHVVD